MTNYQVQENGFVQRSNDDGTITIIPNHPANSDYQAYLNPVEHLTGSTEL
jgi:hypothetical protein